MTADNTDNRREHPRAAVKLKVSYRRVNEFIQDYARNISKGGMFIESSALLDMGAAFNLELEVPTLGEPLVIKARVQWLVQESDAQWNPEEIKPGMGVQFIYESDEERRRVETTVEGLIRRHLGPRAYDQMMGKGQKG